MSADWSWKNLSQSRSIEFICAYCGREVGENLGYDAVSFNTGENRSIRICHNCQHATYFDNWNHQYPAPAFGQVIETLSGSNVGELYNEARLAFSVNSFTAVTLCCRILLMHVAVDQGAKEGQSFLDYVEYLRDEGIVPKRAVGWVDAIRKIGNVANHEIKRSDRSQAESILRFTEMLLRITYEYPAAAEGFTEDKDE